MFMSCFSSCVSRHESPECSGPRIQPLLDVTAAGYRNTTEAFHSHAVEADGKIENITKQSVKNDKTFIICPEMSAGISAPRWWWSHVGPLFDDQQPELQADAILLRPGFAAAAGKRIRFPRSHSRIYNGGQRHSCTISCAFGCGQNSVAGVRTQNRRCCTCALVRVLAQQRRFLLKQEAGGAPR